METTSDCNFYNDHIFPKQDNIVMVEPKNSFIIMLQDDQKNMMKMKIQLLQKQNIKEHDDTLAIQFIHIGIVFLFLFLVYYYSFYVFRTQSDIRLTDTTSYNIKKFFSFINC
jgi:hypothetical protein